MAKHIGRLKEANQIRSRYLTFKRDRSVNSELANQEPQRLLLGTGADKDKVGRWTNSNHPAYGTDEHVVPLAAKKPTAGHDSTGRRLTAI
jgi:hypothetical protein